MNQPPVEVVTRYGGFRHLATPHKGGWDGRMLTHCSGTSAWTIDHWSRFPDHPLGLTAEQMRTLPSCERCKER